MKLAFSALVALIFLVVAGVAVASAPFSDISSTQTGPSESPDAAPAGEGYEPAQMVPGWQQVNSNGFGVQQAGEVSALEVFNGYLYAGTSNPTDGARIFRSPDGMTWTAVTEPGFNLAHDIEPPAILDLTVFNGRIYASTGRGDGPAQIWRALDGVHWAPMVIAGFSNPDTVDITALVEFDGMLYAGATNLTSSAQIWRSYTGDSNTWIQAAVAAPDMTAAGVTGLAVFDGALYAAIAAIEADAPAQVWRSYGGDWTAAVDNGFGNSGTTMTGGMAAFGGYLYAGAGHVDDGAQLWRTSDGEGWQQMIDPGFGDPNNKLVEMVFVFQSHLYAGVENAATGIELWRSSNGTVWERANQDGFGDSHNTTSNKSNAAAQFRDQLYAGTVNILDGGELWRMQPPYGVALSADQAKLGLAGQTVTYTVWITNTGAMTDTFDLQPGACSWTTTLSTQSITLAPSSSKAVTITVSIPPAAAALEHEHVTIRATSRQDSSAYDIVILTTVSSGKPVRLYVPNVLAKPPK